MTFPNPIDPVSALTRADGSTEKHSVDHGRVIHVWENVMHHGATGDGTTDDSVAIQDAYTAAGTDGRVFFPPGFTYHTGTTTITITCNTFSSGADISYNGTGTAIQVGNGTDYLLHRLIELPEVRYTGTARTAGTVGVKVRGIAYGTILHVGMIKEFETGLYMTASNLATAYAQVFLQVLDSNQVNLLIDGGTGTGYCNEINYYGGEFRHNSAIGANSVGFHHIKMLATNVYPPNHHRFSGPSLEGDVHENDKTVVCQGDSNIWWYPRMEAARPGFYFDGADADWNTAITNYRPVITNTHANAVGNRVVTLDGDMWEAYPPSGKGILRLSNRLATTDPVLVATASGTAPWGDTSTLYMYAVGARYSKMKSESDTSPRIQLDHATGEIQFGSGVALDVSLSRSAANQLTLAAGDSFRHTGAVHGSLPSAASYAAGSQYYCITDKQPLWSDGTVWVEADGTNH